MRAVIYNGIGEIDVEDRPMPELGPKDVLVKNNQGGICGTDIGAYLRGGDDVGIFPGNQIGHEFVSEIVEVGPEVDDARIAPGIRIWVNPTTSKRQGEGRSPVEIADSAGGLSEYISLHDAAIDYNIHPLPDNVSFDKAVLIEPLSVANHGVNTAVPKEGERAVIYGAGAIGLGVLCNLRANGIEDIVVVDVADNRLKVVEELGGIPFNAHNGDPIEFLTERFGGVEDMYGTKKPNVDMYFDSAGTPNAIGDYVRGSKPGARCIVLALSGNTVEIPQAAFVLSELTIQGSTAYNATDINQVIQYMAEERYDPSPIITHRFSQEDAKKAFETAVEHKDEAIKVVINVTRSDGEIE